MSEAIQPLKDDTPITFRTLLGITTSHSAATVATAIEEHGIYTRDDYNRIAKAKAEDDTGKGWGFWFKVTAMGHLEHHEFHMSGDTNTAPRNTQSRAMALLALWHKINKYDPYRHEVDDLFREMTLFGWPVEDTPDFDAIAVGVVTVTVEEPIRRQRSDGEFSTSQLIGAMAYLLADSKPKCNIGERPNAKAIAKMAKDIAKSKTTENVKTGSWRNIIGRGIKKYTGA